MICPVCGNETELCNCVSCGFDISLWCEGYPTLSYFVYSGEPIARARKALFVRTENSVQQARDLGALYLEYESVKNHCAVQAQTIRDITAELKQLRTSAASAAASSKALDAENHALSDTIKALKAENEELNDLCGSQADAISRMSEEMKRINEALSRELYKNE